MAVNVTDEQVHAFMDLFRGYPNRFGRFVTDGTKDEDRGKSGGKARTENRPPNMEDFRRHLEGVERVGVIPLDEDNNVRFCALDIDVYNDMLPIGDFAKKTKDLPLICTSSKSGGIHSWMFVKPPLKASIAIKVMKHWAGELGHSKCEVFPKQAGRATPQDVGNWINIPYFGDTCKATVWDEKTSTARVLELDEFIALAQNTNPSSEYLEGGAFNVVARDKGASINDFEDGPPCFQTILKKISLGELDPTGTRNDLLFGFNTYLKRKHSADKAGTIIRNINSGMYTLIDTKERGGPKEYKIPSDVFGLPESEIVSQVLRKTDKEYGYKCTQFPLADFCQKAICKKRKYGVGSDKRGDIELDIGNLVQYKSTPVKYFLDVEGKRVVFNGVDELYNFQKFKNRVVDATGVHIFDMTKKQWDEFLGFHTATMDMREPEPEPSEHVLALVDFIAENEASMVQQIDTDGKVFYDKKKDVYVFLPHSFRRFWERTRKHLKWDIHAVKEELVKLVDLSPGTHSRRLTNPTKDQPNGTSIRAWEVPKASLPEYQPPEKELDEESPF